MSAFNASSYLDSEKTGKSNWKSFTISLNELLIRKFTIHDGIAF
jgi:hypothetical protein